MNKQHALQKRIIFGLLFLGGVTLSYASTEKDSGLAASAITQQTVTVKGTVKDAAGEAIIGASVMVEGTTNGLITNVDGHFSIQASVGQNLIISYIGYESQTVKVTRANQQVNITLKESSELIDEVVVVAYGTQKKANLTGAVASVKVNDIKDIPASNTSSLLQGRMSGVTVSSFSAQPGVEGDVEIRIRGINTFGDSNPMVLIDGVEGSLSSIAPNDIENISVLKDAASASIYGVRAANGVVLITTKRGNTDKKTLSYSGSYGVQKATILPTYINSWDWATLYNEQNEAMEDPSTNYTPEMIQQMKDGSKPNLFANTRWSDKLFRSAPIQTHHLSMSGGNENSHYMGSIGYVGQDGIMKGTSTDRFNFRLNADSKYIDMITLGLNVSGNHEEVEEPTIGTYYVFEQMKWHSRPSVPYQYSNGEWGFVDGNDKMQAIKNPAYATTVTSKTKHNRFDGKAFLEIEPIKNLSIKTSFAYQYNQWNSVGFDPAYIPTDSYGKPVGGSGKNYMTDAYYAETQWINENIITYHFDVNGHAFNFLLGQSNQYNDFRSTTASGEDLPSNNLSVLNGALSTSAKGDAAEAALRSFFGRVNYNFKDRYLAEFNLRRDESSRIPKKNRTGYFPSVSVGWNIAQEAFMKNINFVNQLKLRGSWGELGNQEIGYYPFAQYIGLGNNYVWGDKKVSGVAISSLANPDIKWETTATTDIGIDAAFFNNKITFTADYFYKKTSDILLQLPIPGIVGISTEPYVNAASIKNEGWELALGYNDQWGDWRFGANVNLSKVKNEILDLHGKESWISDWSINLEGHPINSYYGYVADGLYRTQAEVDEANEKNTIGGGGLKLGDVRYKDISGADGKPDGVIDTYDRTVIGNPFPDFTYGFGLNAGYKGFDFSAFFQGVAGVDRIVMDYPTISGNVTTIFLDRYSEKANPNGNFPRLGNGDYNSQPSSFWLKDASYLRLKNIELGYSFKSEWIRKARLERLRIYVSAQNLFTITGIDDYDPEKYGSDTRGHAYPNAKTFSFGLNITL